MAAVDFTTRNELLLRDYLRTHPGDAARYAALKRQLAAADLSGDEYTRAKTGLIQELTDAARAERGLPSVPVWEEQPTGCSTALRPGAMGTGVTLTPLTRTP